MSTIEPRDARLARWLELTRVVLPAMSGPEHWPVQLDHCFMRICLDAAFGAPWTQHVAAPAIRNMSEPQLEAAIAIAESIVAEPSLLPALNTRSLSGRRWARAAA